MRICYSVFIGSDLTAGYSGRYEASYLAVSSQESGSGDVFYLHLKYEQISQRKETDNSIAERESGYGAAAGCFSENGQARRSFRSIGILTFPLRKERKDWEKTHEKPLQKLTSHHIMETAGAVKKVRFGRRLRT